VTKWKVVEVWIMAALPVTERAVHRRALPLRVDAALFLYPHHFR